MAPAHLFGGTAAVYQNVLHFINRDVCSFMMKRLSSYHLVTYHHSLRVAMYSLSVADMLGISESDKTLLLRSALLHDIGKLNIPLSILNKKGGLIPEELKIIRGHCVLGVKMLTDLIKDGWVDRDIILEHHENLDGSGYPLGKTERDLSLFVRIVRVTDSYDAMTFMRGYNMPKTIEEALSELYRWSDVCYDSKAVQCLHKILTEGEGKQSDDIGRNEGASKTIDINSSKV